MNQPSVTAARPQTRTPVFFWVTVGLLALLFLGGVAAAVLLVFAAGNINRSGGWGWLLVGAIYMVAITVVCFLCAVGTAISLFRRERYRGLSIAILIISGLVVSVFGTGVIRFAIGLRHQRDEARASEDTRRSTADSADKRSSASARAVDDPQILELRSRVWEAIRAKNADAFVDFFHVEERFNTPEIREENRNQIEILLRGETLDVEIREIPARELAEIMKIQNAKPASQVRYSLVPKMILRIRQEHVGRSFLIGERNGKWHIVTMAGRPT